MPLSLRRGRVTAIVERHEGLLRLEVDGEACVAYPGLTGLVEVDDEVLVNVQAPGSASARAGSTSSTRTSRAVSTFRRRRART